MLGAGTVLVRMTRDRFGAPMLDLTGSKERILALLALAYERKIPVATLGHIERAAKHWMQGDRALAHIDLAFARLPQLHDEKAMCRLFLGERLIAGGTAPHALMKALNLDRAPEVEKFNPYQPRVPAGNGRESGEWTSGEGDGGGEPGENDTKIRSASFEVHNTGHDFPLSENVDDRIKPAKFAESFDDADQKIGSVEAGAWGPDSAFVFHNGSVSTIQSNITIQAFDGSHVVNFAPTNDNYAVRV